MTQLRATYQLPAALATAVNQAAVQAAQDDVVGRIWRQDHTVWQPEPTEITRPNRLGWLDIAPRMRAELAAITDLRAELAAAGYQDLVLLGMGGSSLAPEVLATIFGSDGLRLTVLDSTAPEAVLAVDEAVDLARTLFIVSSKSGGTVETFSLFKYFYNRVVDELGAAAAGEHFIAITDPGSGLAGVGEQHQFRRVFINDPNIGGRYSALSLFGLVLAGLIGLDLDRLLASAEEMAAASAAEIPPGDNPAAFLGLVMGVAAQNGRDKLTLITGHRLASFGYWLEQLIAESTGKAGMGILPVEGEPLGPPEVYGDDRLFVYLKAGPGADEAALARLAAAGQPVIRIELADAYELGGEMWRWEMATAVAGHLLGINPFDQPNVESAKIQARKFTAAYAETGELPRQAPAFAGETMAVYADFAADSVAAAWEQFLQQAEDGDYLAIQAYLPPTAATSQALLALRTALRDELRLATTTGYGPRFLHSTGQLHKGDGGNGLFIVLTADAERDAAIPRDPGSAESDMRFSILILAQALGDMQALRDANRRLIRFHLDGAILAGIDQLRELVASG